MRSLYIAVAFILFATTCLFSQSITITLEATGVAASPLTPGSTNQNIFGIKLAKSGGGAANATGLVVQLSQNPSGKFTNPRIWLSMDNTLDGGDTPTSGSFVGNTAVFTGSPLSTFGGMAGPVDRWFFLTVDVDPAATGSEQPSISDSDLTADCTVNSTTVTGTNFAFLTTSIGSLNAGANNVAASPLVAGTNGKAIFGFSLTSGGTQTVTALNFAVSSDPSAKISSFSLVRSTDTDFATGGNNTTIGGLTFNATATQIQITAGLSESITTTAKNYFLVANIDPAVTGATANLQVSLAAANVTAGTGTVNGSATGTDYLFAPLTTTIASLNAGANNVAIAPLVAATTGKAIFGFSLTSGGTQTVTLLNFSISSDPATKISSFSLVRSTDADFATGGNNTTIGGLTFNATATQIQITAGLSESITSTAKNYFLVANIDPAVTGATPNLQVSLAAANVTVGTGVVGGSATGTNYNFAGLTTTIASLNAGANNVAASPLRGSATGKAVFGFSLTSTSTQTVTAVAVQLTSDPAGKLSNWSLVKSTDTDFGTGGNNSTIAAGITFTPSGTQVNITGLNQSITTAATSNYFLVADVDPSTTLSTPAIQASITAANVTASTGSVTGSATGKNFTFEGPSTIVTNNAGQTSIDLAEYSLQTASGLTTANSLRLFSFDITDNDTDALPTTITDLVLQMSAAAGVNLKTIALFDDGSSTLIPGSELDVATALNGANQIDFNLITISVPDGAPTVKTIAVYATFNAQVVDTNQIPISLVSITASAAGSGLATLGTVQTTAGRNPFNVVATEMRFSGITDPINPFPPNMFGLTIKSTDINGNTDVGHAGNITLTYNSGSGTLTASDAGGVTRALSSGSVSWTQLKASAIGAKVIRATDSGGLPVKDQPIVVASVGAAITKANPLTVCFNGDFQDLTNIVLTESEATDFGTGANQLFYLKLPTGFIFDVAVTTKPMVSGPDISNASFLSYVGNNIVRFSYNVAAGATGIDNFSISGLRVKYTGTSASTGDIKVVDASAQVEGDTEVNGKSHGLLTASPSATIVDFSVLAFSGDPTVQPNQVDFAPSNKAVKLVGSPSGGVFTGSAVILSGTNGYTFDPTVVGVGTYPITYTYTEPAAPHCQITVTKNFSVSVSWISGLADSYCTTSATSAISVSQATINQQHPPQAGLFPYNFVEFVYWEPSTNAFTTMPAPNAVFNPSDPIYAGSINGYGRIWMGYRVKSSLTGITLPDGPGDYSNIIYTSFVVIQAPKLLFDSDFPTSICVNGAAIDLDQKIDPAPITPATDNFTGTAVTTPAPNQWLFTPSSVPGASTSQQNVNIAYHYKDLSTGCSNTLITTITVYPLPPAVPLSVINSNAGAEIQICQGDLQPTFTATPIGGTSYNWYNAGNFQLSAAKNTFQPQVPSEFNNLIVGSTTFKITQTVNGCEGPTTNLTATVNQPVNVNAGTSVQICAASSLTLSSLGASISGPVSTGTWSTSTGGTFSPNTSFTTATTYTPSAAEVLANSVKLTLTSTDPAGPCLAAQSSVTVVINSATTVIPGNPTSLCVGQGERVALNGKITGGITTGTWSRTGGSGVFKDTGSATSTLLSDEYLPTPAEINSPIPINITFTLTSDDPAGPCGAIANSVIYTLEPAPVVLAGVDQVLCADQSVNLSGTFSAGAADVTWSHTGLGSFTNPTSNASPANTAYTPAPTEITNGTLIRVMLTTNDPTGPCKEAISSLTVTINPVPPPPIVNTPPATPGKIYYCVNDVIDDLVAGGSNVQWYNNPGLTGLPATGTTFTPPTSTSAATTATFYVTQTNLGCESKAPLSSPTAVQLIVDPLPVPNFSASQFCFPDSTVFDASLSTVSGGFSIVQYGWDFDDQTVITAGAAGAAIVTNNTRGTYEKPLHYFANGNYDVTLNAISNSTKACSKSIKASLRPNPNNQLIKIGPYPIPDFTVGKVCLTETTEFVGLDKSSNVAATNSWSWNFGDPLSASNTGSTKTPSHKYDSSKTYPVNLIVTSVLGCQRSIAKNTAILPYIKNFPLAGYFEDFNDSTGGWATEGLNTNQLTSWQHTKPADRVITTAFSGPNAWMTNADTTDLGDFRTYSDNERSVLNGPCFDMTMLTRPVLFFKYWENLDKNDGVYMEVDTTGGLDWKRLGQTGQGLGWYDKVSILGLSPANGIGQTLGQEGWSGRSYDWLDGKFNMDNYKQAKKLRIRFVLGTNGDNPPLDTLDGFALDDFGMANRNRTLLAENFTNLTADGADHNNSKNFYNFKNGTSTSELIKIEYHFSMGGSDIFYEADRPDMDARAGFYGVSRTSTNANAFQGFIGGKSSGKFPVSGGWSDAAYEVESLVTSPLDIEIETPASPDSTLNVKATVTINKDMPPGQYVIQIALIENLVGTKDKFILRKMLPDAAGTILSPITAGGTPQSAEYSWNMSNVANPAQLAVVAFVQDVDTKVAIQAKYLGTPTLPAFVSAVDPTHFEAVGVYPNPSNDGFTVQLPSPANQNVNLRLWDQVGKLVRETTIPVNENTKNIGTSDLATGVYILQMDSPNGSVGRVRVLVMHSQ